MMLFPSVIGKSSFGQRNTLPTSPTFEIIISFPNKEDFDKKLYECSSTYTSNEFDFKSVFRIK